MDKSWIELDTRSHPDYIKGVKEFLNFAKSKLRNEGVMRCPCSRCHNCVKRTPTQVRDHIFIYGMLKSYVVWDHHGEYEEDTVDNQNFDDLDTNIDVDDDLDDTFGIIHDMCNATHVNVQGEGSHEHLDGEEDSFASLFLDASQSLYHGSKMSKLSFIIKLLHIKLLNGWSNKSFDMLLEFLKEVLPSDAHVPSSYYNSKKVIRDLGMKYEKIHACKNDCVLYWNELKDAEHCPRCGLPRFKFNDYTSKKIPFKVLRYFPLKPRLQRLFVTPKVAEDMRWHKEKRGNDDGIMRHPADSKEWKQFDELHVSFSSDPRNVRLGLSSDGFNPFNNISKSYSMWPVILVPYNLPPWRCMKDPFFMLSLLIPGPKAPGNDIDVYLQPLIQELKELWDVGVTTFDASVGKSFQLHAAVLWTINDFPAYANLSGWSTKGKLACPVCNKNTCWCSLKHGKKICYMGHRRFRLYDHKWRKMNWLNGKEHRAMPMRLSADQVLEQLAFVEEHVFGKGTHASRKRKRDASHLHWTKKSIFYELPYWNTLTIRHNLDVMHIEKNVCDNVLGTLMNIEGKTKDTYNSRLDLENFGIRKELHPVRIDGRISMPQAAYVFNDAEKISFCRFVHSMKLPDGFASNISACVNTKDWRIQGLKSHDCHVILQCLLPLALRGLLRKDVSSSLIHLCNFFKELTSRSLKVEVLEKLECDIAIILCKLEQIFPPAFFDVMVHLAIHLPREALIAGPIQFRWMYPFERYMHKLKAYVRNKARSEGSIAEGYIDNECLTFCSMYYSDMETRWNRNERNYDYIINEDHSSVSVFQSSYRALGGRSSNELTEVEWEQIRWYVLNNCVQVHPFIREHLEVLQNDNQTDLHMRHQKEFPEWFLQKVLNSHGTESTVLTTNDIIKLATGPERRVSRLSGCIINGHRFHTRIRDNCRMSQNSGVVVEAEHDNKIMEFYGCLTDIIELTYVGRNRVLIFRCDWWDIRNKKGIRVDEYGFVSVNVTKQWYKDQPFVLASQVEQVFYVADMKLGKDWRVVQRMQPRNVYNLHIPTGSREDDGEPYQQQQNIELNILDGNTDVGLLRRDDTQNIVVDVEVQRFIDSDLGTVNLYDVTDEDNVD